MENEIKKSILVIDDEYDLCELIKMILNKEGFIVECAYTLAEASEKLLGHPDIVLLDNNMPDGTGLAYLQMHPVDFMNSFVVMISADPSKELQNKASNEGIRDFIPKPFSMARMRAILKEAA
jgi:DNA-binding response OmpR family regulator